MSVIEIIEQVKTLGAAERRQVLAQLEGSLIEESAEMRLQRALYEDGLLEEIKPPFMPSAKTSDTPPIKIKGKPLSETIIEERR